MHPVCPHRRRGNPRLKLHLFVLRMDYASRAANLDIFPETALRTRTNWLFVQLAAEMAVATTTRPATIILGLLLMLVVMLTTLILKKLKINLLL